MKTNRWAGFLVKAELFYGHRTKEATRVMQKRQRGRGALNYRISEPRWLSSSLVTVHEVFRGTVGLVMKTIQPSVTVPLK